MRGMLGDQCSVNHVLHARLLATMPSSGVSPPATGQLDDHWSVNVVSGCGQSVVSQWPDVSHLLCGAPASRGTDSPGQVNVD